jgi:uncharacterized C2H2 Zn-finger protein
LPQAAFRLAPPKLRRPTLWVFTSGKVVCLSDDDRGLAMRMQMFPCPHCPAVFDRLKSLEHHLKIGHDDTPPSEKFRCVTCDADFYAQAEWLTHLQDEHEDVA